MECTRGLHVWNISRAKLQRSGMLLCYGFVSIEINEVSPSWYVFGKHQFVSRSGNISWMSRTALWNVSFSLPPRYFHISVRDHNLNPSDLKWCYHAQNCLYSLKIFFENIMVKESLESKSSFKTPKTQDKASFKLQRQPSCSRKQTSFEIMFKLC
jgi:hypothetical protein